MVDIHCHILPGVDDGSRSWEMTTKMCRIAVRDGITHIVATPHSNGEFAYDRSNFTGMLEQLSAAANDEIAFSLGCDFHFSYDNIRDALAHPRRYTIGDSRYLLVEFSDYGLPPSVKQDLHSLLNSGIVPVITHPERNQILLRRPELVMAMVEQGCLVQVTANAVTGYWGLQSQKMAEWLLKRDSVHVLATDAHDPGPRSPVLSLARDVVAKLAGAAVAEILVTHNPAAIVAGQGPLFQPRYGER